MQNKEKAWIWYDVANSAFVLIITTTLMPLFFKNYAARELALSESTAYWGFTVSLSSLMVALLAPLLGTMADYKNKKKVFFIRAVIIGVGATFLLVGVNASQWLLCAVIYFTARTAYSAANIFYDSFLTDVTSPQRFNKISGYGFAYGYIGSVIPFLLAVAALFTARALTSGSGFPGIGYKIAFIITGCWWALFTIPFIKHVKHSHYIRRKKNLWRHSWQRLRKTFKKIKKYRNIFLFLLAYFFYIDGVYTIISMAMAYGIDQGLSYTVLISVILLIQLLGWPCALLFVYLAQKTGVKRMLYTGIITYLLLTVIAFFLPLLETAAEKIFIFIVMGVMTAFAQGGLQSLSRSFYAGMIPRKEAAEFFGFYNI
ncbi:MAG TPA: MFS transporter, partial [Spirochaetota bacterium]|nr:MFS transporter [Spirochaetota bacterium]